MKKVLLAIILILILVISFSPKDVEIVYVEVPDTQLITKNYNQEKILKKFFGTKPIEIDSTEVTITAYTAREEETNCEPWRTADLTPSYSGILAVSRDLLNFYGLKYGQIVKLEPYGVFTIHDTMNKRFTKRVDILMANYTAARKFGKQKGVLVWVK